MRRLALTALIAAAPAVAQNLDPAIPAAPGAVAMYVSAQRLYAMGVAGKDPHLVVTAARLMRGLLPSDTPRPPAPPMPLVVTDAAAMLDMARKLDVGQNYTDLIEAAVRDLIPAPRSLRSTAATLDPGQSQTWSLPFFGGTYAEVAISGQGSGNLDLTLSDDKGAVICQDMGNGDTALCGFAPLDNGTFTLTVTNTGPTPDAYLLLTD